MGTKNIESREPIPMAEVDPYWKPLWGEEAQLNERTEWIRREANRKMGNMDLGLIQIMKITTLLSKAHNWKSPGND